MAVFQKSENTGGKRGGWPTPGKRANEKRSTWGALADRKNTARFSYLGHDEEFDWKDFIEEATCLEIEDDGFNIQHLLISLLNFDFDIIRKTTPTPTPSSQSKQTPANQLVECIHRVILRTSASRRQEKLQDLLLEWLHCPKKIRPAKKVDLDSFVDGRQDFWNTYKASTTKWEGLGTVSGAFVKGPPSPTRTLDAAGGVAKSVFPNAEKRGRQQTSSGHRLSDAAVSFQKQCALHRPVSAPAALEAVVGQSKVLPRSVPPELRKFPPGFEEARGISSKARPNSAAELRQQRAGCRPCSNRAQPNFPTLSPQARRFAREQHNAKPKLEKSELYLAAPVAMSIHPYTRQQLIHKAKPLGCEDVPVSPSKMDVRRMELANTLTPAGPPSEQSTPKTPSADKLISRPSPTEGLYGSDYTASIVQTAVWRYFKECELANVMPRRPRFLVEEAADEVPSEDTKKVREVPYLVSVRDQAMQDRDLGTLCQPLKAMESTCINVDLAYNHFSDAGVAHFLAGLPKNDVRSLDLSHSGAASEAVNTLFDRMDRNWTRLSTLQLGGNGLTEDMWRSLCTVLTEHGSIRRLDLVDMSLGKLSQSSIKYVTELASVAPYLEYLDLSGNFFFHDGFEMLADSVKQTKSIRCLHMSHNASTQGVMPRRRCLYRGEKDYKPKLVMGLDGNMYEDLPNFHPAALLCEAVSENTSLTELRMQDSWLDFSVDCTLLNALLRNKSLQILDLSHNPHGQDGLRAILRLMMHPSQSLVECEIGGFREGVRGPGVVQLEFGTPSGHYELELNHPQHRAVVQWLFRVAESNGCYPPESAFAVSKWSGRPQPWFQHTPQGVEVARHGHLSFDLDIPLHLDKEKNAGGAINKWLDARRVQVTLSRFVPLLQMLEGLKSIEQQEILIKAIGDTCLLKTCHVKKLVHQCPKIADIVVRSLFANIEDCDPLLLFSIMGAHHNLGRSFRRETRGLFFFNPHNPTNQYVLHLNELMDRQLAERLHVVNRYEAAIASRRPRSDTSQHGNFEGARNIHWEEKEGKTFKSFINFHIPDHGVLCLDYVSPPPFAPCRRAKTTPDSLLDQLIQLCELSNCGPTDKVMALRSTMHCLVLDLRQIRKMCDLFPNPKLVKARRTVMCPKLSMESAFQYRMENCRIEMFVLLFNCCNDTPTLCTSELQWDLNMFTMACGKEIRERVGSARTMDALHCCKSWGVPPQKSRKTWPQREIVMAGIKAARREEAEGGPDAIYKKKPEDVYALAKKEPGRRYVLDLSVHEDWAVARFLVAMSDVEDGWTLNRCNWTGRGMMAAAGVDFIVPPSWLKDIPQYGIFTCTYLSESPDKVCTNERRTFAEKYLGWEPLSGT